jgi:hypothetical protein
MIEKHPLSDRLLRGEWWRYPSPPREKREPDPEVLEVLRRAREKSIREYEERRRRRAS